MARDNPISRRTAMKLTGAAAATALVAGCSDDDDDGNGNGDEDDSFDIDPDEQVLLEGYTGGYEGLEPSSIEGETNPTLNLQDGETYEIGWTQGDGADHNVVIWDEDEELVGEYYSGDSEEDTTGDPGDGDFVEFEASEEMAYYRCYPHPNMQGELNVE